jgi:hypothetical protein
MVLEPSIHAILVNLARLFHVKHCVKHSIVGILEISPMNAGIAGY